MFSFGKVGLSTGSTKVEVAGLDGEFCSFYAYLVFADICFGVTVRIVPLGVCRNGAAELAIDVEADSFRGIVEEPKVRFRHVLRCREGDVNQPDRERRDHSPANHLPS